MPNWKKIILNGGAGELTTLKLTNLTEDSTGTKVLTLDANDNIKLTGSFGGGGGTVTSIASGDGLTGGTITNSGTLAVDSTVVRTTGAQTIGGNKTFSSSVIVGTTNGQDKFNIQRYNGTYPFSYIQAGATDENVEVGLKIDTRNNSGIAGNAVTFDGDTKLATFPASVTVTNTLTAGTSISLAQGAGIVLDGNAIYGIDDSGEFTNDDSHIMTSAAVEDKILGYGYGTGDVNKTGTPADNQIATFTNSTTIEGDSNLTFDKSTDIFVGGNQLRANSGGSATAPAFGWSAQTNTGMYFTYSPNEILFTTAGVERVKIGANTTISSGTIQNTAGTAGAPSYTFSGNTDTGIYGSSVSDQLNITTGGSNRFSVSTTEIQALLPFQSSDGAKSAPQYSFGNDNDTGMYLNGNGILAFATAGDNRLLLSAATTEVENTLKLDSVAEGSDIQRYLVWDTDDGNVVKWRTISFGTVTSVTAGTGMTQTGTSTVNPTLNVIGGDGITANANDVAVDSTVVRTSGAEEIGGSKTFSSNTVFPGSDGGMEIGVWAQSSDYGFIGTANMTGLEYCMISDGTNTFLGAGSNGILKLRGPANDSSPEILLNGTDVEVNSGDLKIPDGSLAVGNISNSATDGRIDASNDVVAFSTSDERLKKYIKNIKNPLEKISKINGVTFEWKKTDDKIKKEVHSFEGNDVGVIAQEVEKVLPEVVQTRDNGYKAVKYEKIVPLLIESIKELKAEIEELKKSK